MLIFRIIMENIMLTQDILHLYLQHLSLCSFSTFLTAEKYTINLTFSVISQKIGYILS